MSTVSMLAVESCINNGARALPVLSEYYERRAIAEDDTSIRVMDLARGVLLHAVETSGSIIIRSWALPTEQPMVDHGRQLLLEVAGTQEPLRTDSFAIPDIITAHTHAHGADGTVSPLAELVASLLEEHCFAVRSDLQRARFASCGQDLVLFHAGGHIPFQAEGTWLGYLFYFRFRSGAVSLSIGAPAPENAAIANPLWYAEDDIPDDLVFTFEMFLHQFARLSRQLKPAEFLYKFQLPDGQPAFAWALDKETALGIVADQKGIADASSIRGENADDRVFPARMPAFVFRP